MDDFERARERYRARFAISGYVPPECEEAYFNSLVSVRVAYRFHPEYYYQERRRHMVEWNWTMNWEPPEEKGGGA